MLYKKYRYAQIFRKKVPKGQVQDHSLEISARENDTIIMDEFPKIASNDGAKFVQASTTGEKFGISQNS